MTHDEPRGAHCQEGILAVEKLQQSAQGYSLVANLKTIERLDQL